MQSILEKSQNSCLLPIKFSTAPCIRPITISITDCRVWFYQRDSRNKLSEAVTSKFGNLPEIHEQNENSFFSVFQVVFGTLSRKKMAEFIVSSSS